VGVLADQGGQRWGASAAPAVLVRLPALRFNEDNDGEGRGRGRDARCFVEINGSQSLDDQACQIIPERVVPAVREAGARAGYWLTTLRDNRAIALLTFDSEGDAKRLASHLVPGEALIPHCTYRAVEVQEVMASL
jgi:hypothetical protein